MQAEVQTGNERGSTQEEDGLFKQRPHHDSRPLLAKASFFLGDLRDGLPMVSIRSCVLKTLFQISNCIPLAQYASCVSNFPSRIR